MKKPITRNKKLSTRGVVTLSCLASMMSLPLAYAVYINEYARRALINNNYNGNPGGEMFIPFAIYMLTYIILDKVNRRDKYVI